MKRARAWTGNTPEPEAEQARLRVIRATRKAWELFCSTANKRDRALTMKDTPLQAQLDAELVECDHRLGQLEAQLARLDQQCDQTKEERGGRA